VHAVLRLSRVLRPRAGLLALAALAALAAAQPLRADSSPSSLLSIDQYLLRADFAGEVVVAAQSWDAVQGLQRIRFRVVDPWFSRWTVGRELSVVTSPAVPAFRPGARHVVFLSGGPWEESPFTFRQESVFTVAPDGTVRCRSGNPLFGVLNDGFLCTAQELVEGQPLRTDQMRAQVLRARAKAARRLPELAARLSASPRSLEAAPSAAAAAEEVRR
jgi:hypothetical protein